MSELIHKLGIDWRLLIAQLANFAIILIVLRLTVYKPLLKMLRERSEKIAKGVSDAEAAAVQLTEAEAVKAEKLAEAESEALRVMTESEERAKRRGDELISEAQAKEEKILQGAARTAAAKEAEATDAFYSHAGELIKSALASVARTKPSLVDDALLDEAVSAMKKSDK